jgi:hypothetical protein
MNFSGIVAFSLQRRITARISHLAATFFDVRIQKLVSHSDKCPNSEGDYVDK